MRAGELRKLAEKVTAELAKVTGEAWAVVPNGDPQETREWYVKIQLGDDPERRIGLRQTPSGNDRADLPGQVEVSGNLPRHGSHAYPDQWQLKEAGLRNPSAINVSDQKTPAQIARDISRRLLPDWTAAFDLGRSKIDAWQAAERSHAETAADLARDCYLVRTDRFGHEFRRNDGKLNPDVKVNSARSVTITMSSISPEVARAVLDALAHIADVILCRDCGSKVDSRGHCTEKACPRSACGQAPELAEVDPGELTHLDIIVFRNDDGTYDSSLIKAVTHEGGVTSCTVHGRAWKYEGDPVLTFGPRDRILVVGRSALAAR